MTTAPMTVEQVLRWKAGWEMVNRREDRGIARRDNDDEASAIGGHDGVASSVRKSLRSARRNRVCSPTMVGVVPCLRILTTIRLRRSKAAIAAVVAWFEAASCAGVIIGGVANAFLGRTRATRDVDGMVVLENDSQIAPFLDKAAAYGIKPRIADAVAFARVNRVLLLRHSPSHIDVDVSCGCLPFETEVLDRSIVDSLLRDLTFHCRLRKT